MLNAESIGARGRRKQAKPQRKSASAEEFDALADSMKAIGPEAALPYEKEIREDDDNHNRVCNKNNNGFGTELKLDYRHCLGPPGLETILRGNESLRKESTGARKNEPSLQHLLHLNTNGDYTPSLNESKTPVIVVKTVSALNNGCHSGDHLSKEFFGMDAAVAKPEAARISKVPLSPAAVKSLSDADSGPDQGVKCPQCPAAFAGYPALQEHLESEHPQAGSPREAFSPTPTSGCAPCNLSFLSKDQLLEKNELLHSPNAQVSCKVCSKQFANVYRLQRHMISHDESAVLRKFKCPECEKAFKFKHHLKEHIRIHSGEKPFQCANCGKRFSHSGSYSSHMTSKKCLVMNLKVSRGRTLGMDKSQVARSLVTPKRASTKGTFQLGPGNGVFPMMPKYGDAAMFPAVSPRSSFAPPSSTPTLHPFYMAAAPTMPPINPYSLPALSHFLEQLTAPMAPRREDKTELEEAGSVRMIKQEIKEEEDDLRASDKDRSSPQSTTGSDLEAVKRILETVNATVTKQLLQANMNKFTSSPSESSSVSPSGEFRKDEIECRHCGKLFQNRIDHHQHERYLCEHLSKSEGLAAKLEDVASDKSANGAGSSDEEDGKEGDMDEEGVAITIQEGADGRKARVRSQIADEHLTVLRHHYVINPRPKREELSRIAEKIGFPVRVVQVWFQNSRARDRREGRLLQVPYLPLLTSNVPLLATNLEQPLDLSTKKARSELPNNLGETEVMNLSRRPPSPRPHTFPNGLPTRRTPSPLAYLNLHQDDINAARLSRIFSHSGVNGANMLGERFIFNADLQAKSPMMLLENGRASSSSPGSDKRSWRHGDLTSETEDSAPADPEPFEEAKRGRFLLGNGFSGSDPEAEGQFICDQCDKAFSKQSSLARHKYEHSGQRPHKCEVCEKAFKHKHHLTEHRRLHSGEKPFQCGKCLKRFSHSGSYSQHMNHRYSYCKPYRD